MSYANPDDRRAYQRAYYRPRRRAAWRRFRAAGGCGHCGVPVIRFTTCTRCRVRAAASKRAARARGKDRAPSTAARRAGIKIGDPSMNRDQAERINTYDQLKAAGGGIAIMQATGGGRETYVSGFLVHRITATGADVVTDPDAAWYHGKRKWFSNFEKRSEPFHVRQRRAFEAAAAWVLDQYGEAGPWVRNRLGDYLPERIHKQFPLRPRSRT